MSDQDQDDSLTLEPSLDEQGLLGSNPGSQDNTSPRLPQLGSDAIDSILAPSSGEMMNTPLNSDSELSPETRR